MDEKYQAWLEKTREFYAISEGMEELLRMAFHAGTEAAQHRVQLTGLCACKIFIPSAHSTALVCRNCGKPPRN